MKMNLILKNIIYIMTINDEKLNNRMNYLNNLVSSLNFGNKIYLMIENIETDLYELMI